LRDNTLKRGEIALNLTSVRLRFSLAVSLRAFDSLFHFQIRREREGLPQTVLKHGKAGPTKCTFDLEMESIVV
jgi:hypothetical protein